MKTVLVLSVLLCAAFAAPAEHKEQAPEAAVEETIAAVPAAVFKEAAAPELHMFEEEAAAPESRSNCPDGWFNHGSHCFMFVNSPMSWYGAEEHCNALGAHLASATNPREYSFLQQITRTAGQTIAWLGGFNLQGQWMWIDREGFYYNNWYSPSSSAICPCAYLRTSGGWGNNHCGTATRFICSKNLFGC